MKTEIERLQDLVSNLRQDLCNALMESRRKDTVIEKCKEAFIKRVDWICGIDCGCVHCSFERKAQDALTAIEALSEKGEAK